jgi:hypothetical protein
VVEVGVPFVPGGIQLLIKGELDGLFLLPVIHALLQCHPYPPRVDRLDRAQRAIARKVISVPDRRMRMNGHDFTARLAWYLHKSGLRRGTKK